MSSATNSELTAEGFGAIAAKLRTILKGDEAFTLKLVAETSQFLRFNRAKVRQTGRVTDGQWTLTVLTPHRSAYRSQGYTGDFATDWPPIRTALLELREELASLPDDPYTVLPTGTAKSNEVYAGELLDPQDVAATLLTPLTGLDAVGIYASGQQIRAYADSVGQSHWFATDTFSLDYSLFTPDGQAVHDTFAGNQWQPETYAQRLARARQQLERLAQPPKKIVRGQYRTYLAPAAMAELAWMLSWGAVSEGAMRRGGSALQRLRQGEATLSPLFSLKDNFALGLVPRFNDRGVMAPLEIPVITQGKLTQTMISDRTAKEYGLVANGADSWEGLRSPEVAPGTLATAEILTALDHGLYLSNLHYLNWSDRPAGRITGMTRYACFWVEHGEIVAPIEDLRFDESLYRLFGSQLLAMTAEQELILDVSSYDYRELGGSLTPGALVEALTYTL
ncbi:MAG: TldD/PmbA family protein [Spirulina sp. SIO3F2]|nr:TldD/PmbA family protein [Spirulina sp. SIO3F2]